ncbi:alpha/beta fold hydrolase [Catenulispora sp. NF23]|uniref:Alpha/beta fold hydrolase n=1 Tax=Catenulispora pinistramenti TaxID=2705254 RepID=A0ABS5KQK0_9ACTN|nr:alpha/beta fold hydrolase [Catenulispora pinistramenti]MBS2538589.1 alpha/beta fold hydrolase [Catenulispora pinistramenti]MBS2548326.1 alpha/beta fold hydrolase [Catenulispora pinistramenti]
MRSKGTRSPSSRRAWKIAVPLAAGALALATSFTAGAAQAGAATGGGDNDPSCKPTAAHPYPVVLLHGLGATYYEDLNFLQADLAAKGYCTFSATYGAYPGFPLVGGLRPINDSAPEIAAFIHQVLTETGATKVDLVGHSEGAFQALYVTKTQNLAGGIDKVVALAPPTHGTTFAGLYSIAQALGIQPQTQAVLDAFGCGACSDLVTGGTAVTTLDSGPIAQPGVHYTVITSRTDELVTPTGTSFVGEPGVTNEYVQDTCPFDPVGHIGEAYDTNVWHLIENALDPQHATGFLCVLGSPG